MDKLSVLDEFGNPKDINFITVLTQEKYNSLYLVYTEKELNDGINEVCFAKIKEEDGQMYLDSIEDEQEAIDVENEFRKEALKND